MNQVIDLSTLTWVKKELDETLKEARQSLEAHVENPQDEVQLGFVAAHLHQVYGTLQMVELYGASLLAEEMESVAKAIAANAVSKQEDACEVLMRAILQLPDYLDRLIAGSRDIPLVLLPILNDLRSVRGENLLSENAMFSPDLGAKLPEAVTGRKQDGDIQSCAKALRHKFQLGLLGCFRGNKVHDALQVMGSVLDDLRDMSSDDVVSRLWWVAGGVVACLRDQSLEGSVSINRLLGQVDREIKRMIDEGESALVQNPALDLFKNLLFYVGQPRTCGSQIVEIQETYNLRDLIPDEQEIAQARESLSGQNADLFATVAVAVKEELARLKDTLDLVLRNGGKDLEDLDPLINSLRSLGDTLGMLSLDAPRKAMIAKAADLSTYRESGGSPPETLLMDIASTLLFVESSVDGMGAGRAVSGENDEPDEHLAQSEYDQVMDVVFQEAIGDLVRGKEAIIEFTDGEQDANVLDPVPQLFNQVKGGLLLLGETRAAALIGSAARYVENDLCNRDKHAAQHELDSLADAVCGLEYYLEGRREHRMYGGSAMSIAEESVEKLGYPAVEEGNEPVAADELALDQASEGATSLDDELLEPYADGVIANEEVLSNEPGPADADDRFDEENAKHGAGEVSSDQFNVTDETVPELENAISEPEDVIDAVDQWTDIEEEDGYFPSEATTPVSDEPEHGEEEPVMPESSGKEISTSESSDIAPLSLTPRQEVDPEDDGLAVIGEEVDEEILEIFIEEAEEEIDSISVQLPIWIGDSENTEALGTMRRSYHTLKGSGRLVGAMRIGEFAWAFENMLNRLIEGAVTVTPALVETLQAAHLALPELVQQIKDGTAVRQPVAHLVSCAEALSKGEPLPERLCETPSEVTAEPNVAVEPALGLDSTMLPIDEASDEGSLESGGTEQNSDYPDDASDEQVDGVMDAMLYEIFNTESQGHLEIIRQFLNKVAAGDPKLTEDVARALHTLHGSAHMAKAGAIADLSGELERYTKALIGADMPISEPGCDALQESAQMIEHMLSSLPFEMAEPDRLNEVLVNVRDLRESVPQPNADPVPSPVEESHETGHAEKPASVNHPEYALEEADPYLDCDAELLEIFLEESEENLEVSDGALHRWRERRDDTEAVEELQRAVHTLKGGARMADLEHVGDLAHAVETLVTAIVDNRAEPGDEPIDGVQKAHDQLVSMLDNVRLRQPILAQDDLIAELMALATRVGDSDDESTSKEVNEIEELDCAVAEAESAESVASPDPYAETDPELLEVFLEEAGDILEHSEETLRAWKDDSQNTGLMAELQRELHTMKGGARMADITEIGDLAHAVESLMAKVTEGDVTTSPALFSVLEQAQDGLNDMIQSVSRREPISESRVLIEKLETLQDGKGLSPEEVVAKPAEQAVKAAQGAEALVRRDDVEHRERRSRARDNQELVRVKAKLLDNMVNYAGEVSIYRSRLEQQVGAFRFNLVEMEQTVSRLREQLRKLEIETEAQILFRYETESENLEDQFDPLEMDRYSHMQQLSRSLVESVSDLGSIQGLLENITGESETLLLQQSRVNTDLQEGLMRTRMVPFLGLAARMRRIVRQTCQSLGKQAELELSGAEGEMDRTVVDRIIAPIEHMLRNAISHGIETPEQRRLDGKAEAGIIRITLERESSDVVLKIADDGAGINLAAIRKKAIERGLMTPDSGFTDTEVLQFILETGFSTAEKVTQVAGRGVGMDVVNSEVKQLGGSLHIDSREGRGTTFTIRLPFTLALNHALLIEVGEDTYAVPLSSIEGIVRMPRADIKKYYDDQEARFEYGGHEYEVRHLGTLLGTGSPHIDNGPKRIPVLLARVGEHCMAFQVENLIGSREIVVKSVGPQISTVRGVSGATILGDGRVVMILDLPAMLRGGTSSPFAEVDGILNRPLRTKGLTVMVVDDSITVRKVTTRLLERNEMNVIAAKDGVDAVSKLQENIPDIMLLDIEMPRMDGFELATHVRNEPRLRDIPIIMITSRTGDKHRQRAMQIGVNRYLGKPFQETELLENIKTLLEE